MFSNFKEAFGKTTEEQELAHEKIMREGLEAQCLFWKKYGLTKEDVVILNHFYDRDLNNLKLLLEKNSNNNYYVITSFDHARYNRQDLLLEGKMTIEKIKQEIENYKKER